jgi:hypothetical protein
MVMGRAPRLWIACGSAAAFGVYDAIRGNWNILFELDIPLMIIFAVIIQVSWYLNSRRMR